MSTSTAQNYIKRATRVSFTSEEHKALNAAINLKFDAWTLKRGQKVKDIVDSSDAGLFRVISDIVEDSKGRLQLPAKSIDLVEDLFDDVNFMELVQRCLDKREYDDLRKLDIFQPIASVKIASSSVYSIEWSINSSVIKAWKEKYVGNYHELLYNNISRMNWHAKYGNTVAIVQSSGTGKSRMVHECASLVFTIPFNLREETIIPFDKQFVYPAPDRNVRNHLRHQHTDYTDQIMYYLAFFTDLFRQLQGALSNMKKEQTYKDLALAWRTYLDTSHRDDIYDYVTRVQPSSRVKLDRDVSGVQEQANVEEANNALESLLYAIDQHVEEKETVPSVAPKLMIYFDDAHVLTANTPPRTLYDALCSAINLFKTQSLFVIFLSTASQLYRPAPPPLKGMTSSRAFSTTEPIQTPITEVPFDCFPGFPIHQNELKLAQLSEISFMAQFGRPLWDALRTSPTLIDAETALIDVQLMLDYETKQTAAREREANLVAKHMRMAYSVTKTREYMRSGYPSEPLLAEAAARLIYRKDIKTESHSWDLEAIARNTDTGLLDRGEIDKLIGHRLLTKAYMRAAANVESSLRPNFSKGAKLVDFLQELIAKGYIEDVLDCRPCADGVPLKDAFKEAYVRFTHWIKMVDNSGTTSMAATAAFLRGAAIICRTNGPAVDLIIPVLMWDEFIGEWVISAILVQIKRRMKAGTIRPYQIDERDVDFFPKNSEVPEGFVPTTSRPHPNDRPYISLVMELGVQIPIAPPASIHIWAKEAVKKGKKRVHIDIDSLSTPKRLRTTTEVPLETSSCIVLPGHPSRPHPRYNIFIYGCSSTCYNVIADGDKGLYAKLLRTRDLLAEHPRDDIDSITAVRTMKPFFSIGRPSYNWFECDLSNEPDYDADLHTAGVLTGVFDEDAVSAWKRRFLEPEDVEMEDSGTKSSNSEDED